MEKNHSLPRITSNVKTKVDDMAELESKIQSRIIKRLEAEGYYVIKLILTNKPVSYTHLTLPTKLEV